MSTPLNSRKWNLLSNGAVESFWDALWLELWPFLWLFHLRLLVWLIVQLLFHHRGCICRHMHCSSDGTHPWQSQNMFSSSFMYWLRLWLFGCLCLSSSILLRYGICCLLDTANVVRGWLMSGTIQRRLAWPLREDDTHTVRGVRWMIFYSDW